MRHPSLDLSPSPTFTDDCIKVCVESSREILHLTDNLRKGNHYLDTTWYGATVQLLATLTILFSVWHKRDSVKSEEVKQVKKDMDLCMDIMGDLGSLLGRFIVKVCEAILTLHHRVTQYTPRCRSSAHTSHHGFTPSEAR